MSGTALVLGGGGVTGAAWEIGLLAGLAAQGMDLSTADLIVGTSAGAVVGAQITSGITLKDLYEQHLAPPPSGQAPGIGLAVSAKWVRAAASSRDQLKVRARLGGMALKARTITERERLAMIADRLPSAGWPIRRLLITAVDADTGEFATFDSTSGAALVEAVAASTAAPCVWPVIHAAGRRWIDGGVRSPVNADLAVGCDPVVVIAPIPRAGFWGPGLPGEVAALRDQGARVAAISPDREEGRFFIGGGSLDPTLRAPAARAGYAQAPAVAAEVAAVWNSRQSP
jgi:NTE family protein